MAAALIPQAALAHARLLQSDPAPTAILASVPAHVTLVFTEPVTPAGAGIKVYSPTGRQVAGDVISRGAVVSACVASDCCDFAWSAARRRRASRRGRQRSVRCATR